MVDAWKVGVEEEFQIVHTQTMELVSGFPAMMRFASAEAREAMKPEFLQCVIECITEPCDSIADIARSTMLRRASAMALAEAQQLQIISAGTHPNGRWYHQHRTIDTAREDRYAQLEDILQEVARSILIFGLHVHINVDDREERIQIFNQARAFLPYILALSVNSPFWMGHLTGYQSYRTMVWAPFPMAGIPDAFESLQAYEDFVGLWKRVRSLEEPRRIWWDIRPHFKHPTVEFRIADMPLNHTDMVAIAAFCQALVRTISERTRAGHPLPIIPTPYIMENRWRAARFGPRGMLIDLLDGLAAARELPAAVVIGRALDLVSDAAASFGTTAAIDHLRRRLQPEVLTGAERQIEAYMKHLEIRDVTAMLADETLRGIDRGLAWPLNAAEPVAFPAAQRRFSA